MRKRLDLVSFRWLQHHEGVFRHADADVALQLEFGGTVFEGENRVVTKQRGVLRRSLPEDGVLWRVCTDFCDLCTRPMAT